MSPKLQQASTNEKDLSESSTRTAMLTRRSTPRLALLDGVGTHIGTASVGAGLKQEEAAKSIERVWKKRRVMSGQGHSPKRQNMRMSGRHESSPCHYEHWLFKSLRSYSTDERRTALAMLRPPTGCADAEYETQKRINTLVRMIEKHVVARRGSVPHQVSLEWTSFLQSLFVYDSRCFIPYWNWITRSIWICADRQNLTALCALTTIVFQMTLRASPPEAVAIPVLVTFNQKLLWNDRKPPQLRTVGSSSVYDAEWLTGKPDANELTPLACLIGAYYSVHVDRLELSETPSAARQAVQMLSLLVDPSAVPEVAVPHCVTKQPRKHKGEATCGPSEGAAGCSRKQKLPNLLEGYDTDFSPEHSRPRSESNGTLKDSEDEDNYHDEDDSPESAREGEKGSNENTDCDEEDDEGEGEGEEDAEDEEDDDTDDPEDGNDGTGDDEEIDSVDQEEEDDIASEENPEDCREYVDAAETDENDEMDEDDENAQATVLPTILERELGFDEDGDVRMEVDECIANGKRLKVDKDRERETLKLFPPLEKRQRLYVAASMEVLAKHYPPSQSGAAGISGRMQYLQHRAENALIKSINRVVKPPRKPLNIKIIMRRAPTQEEFFRGALSKNPISISSLKHAPSRRSSESDSSEPTVEDLRQHIAKDLQMAESAELIEILVANKILDVKLRLRVVHQVLWRKHLIENPSSGVMSFLSSSTSFLSGRSGLSIFFSSSDGRENGDDGNARASTVTESTPVSELPSLLVTYRLAGVDGEATEDSVGHEDLIDPEAPSRTASEGEKEKLLESQYGITRMITNGRGVYVLLRSVQSAVMDIVRRIYRDDVGCVGANPSREKLRQSAPCEALELLRHCTKLQKNRKRLLQARAPTLLLTLLLEILKGLEGDSSAEILVSDRCPTAELLQELIESLTSDISTSTTDSREDCNADLAHDAASMPLLLTSIEKMSLSAPLRRIIAKLLPYLTYGQIELSRELADHFKSHINLERIVRLESTDESSGAKNEVVLTRTLADTLMNLPANEICNSLRQELITCGFVKSLETFIMREIPKQAPSWSPSLWTEGELSSLSSASPVQKEQNVQGWRRFYERLGVKSALKILTGLARGHVETQDFVASLPGFLKSCHWVEATSDSSPNKLTTNGFGILAETLLDELIEGNEEVKKKLGAIRRVTKMRKRSIALQRRKQAITKLGVPGGGIGRDGQIHKSLLLGTASGLAPSSLDSALATASPRALMKRAGVQGTGTENLLECKSHKPSWLTEAELMVEETGLKCVVCQEGRTLQPKEMMGLYVFSKKVVLSSSKNVARSSIDGLDLLKAIPSSVDPDILTDSFCELWMLSAIEAKAAVMDLQVDSTPSALRRSLVFTTTVSAGNAIHVACHRKAKQADRNHSKAPKSEWEGATLRNNRVTCNAILPLLSNQSSSIPLMQVNSGLSEYQETVSNIAGSPVSNMLWQILHDIRFLLLRIAYGESLSVDCGGGSLASNCQLLFHQMHLAETFAKDADVDQNVRALHARNLSAGYLLASRIVFESGGKDCTINLSRSVAGGSIMAALCCISFHNSTPSDDKSKSGAMLKRPHPKREWLIWRESFLKGLILCAGRRHVLNLNSSGCMPARTQSGRKRSPSFADWDINSQDPKEESDSDAPARDKRRTRRRTGRGRANMPTVDDFQNAFRPMVTLFGIFDQLSAEFSQEMDHTQIEESAQRMVQVIETCQRCRSIHELLRKANIPFNHSQLMDVLQKGMVLG